MRYPFERLIDSLEDGLCFINSKLRILYANKAFRKRFSSFNEFGSKKCCYFFSDWLIDCKSCPISNALSTGKRQHKIFMDGENGNTFSSVEITAIPLPESGKVVDLVAVQVRDINEAPDRRGDCDKPAEEQILLSQDNAALTLAAGIAQNFNNALMGIRFNVDMIQRHTLLADYLSQYTDPLQKLVRRMTRWTEQLTSCVHGGKFQPSSVTVKELVDRMVALAGGSMGAEVYLDQSCEFFEVNVDTGQIQNVLISILKNAVEAVEGIPHEGRIKIRCAVDDQMKKKKKQIPTGCNQSFVRIAVEDNGKGMDREARERIFEPFYTTKFQGHGLSMAAANGIVAKHGGYITVDSKPGKGSCVTLSLPADSIWKTPENTVVGTFSESSQKVYKESSY